MLQALPAHWVVRELSKDYGLDLHIETFAPVPEDDSVWEALGEHFFAQVKTVDGASLQKTRTHSGTSSTPTKPIPGIHEDGSSLIEVIGFDLEVSEIETIRRMGSSIPVLLFVVDTKTHITYFICLNDWIAKVLPEFRPNWREQKTVVVHIPTVNIVSSKGKGWHYLSMLAKRPKFYGAFAEFGKYSKEFRLATAEVDWAIERHPAPVPDVTREVESFKQIFDFYYRELVDQEIWGSDERPSLPSLMRARVRLEELKGELDAMPADWAKPSNNDEFFRLMQPLQYVTLFFDALASEPEYYGTLIRNWNLPTELGIKT